MERLVDEKMIPITTEDIIMETKEGKYQTVKYIPLSEHEKIVHKLNEQLISSKRMNVRLRECMGEEVATLQQYRKDYEEILSTLIARRTEVEKGCGIEFVWIKSSNDKRVCGQIEDLKHSDHIVYCPSCSARLDELNRLIGDNKQ